MILTNLDIYSGQLSVLAAGAAGSQVRAVLVPVANRRLMMAHVISGAMMAVFVTPAIVEHWYIDQSIGIQRGLAFCIGLAGPIIVEIAIRVMQRRGDKVAERLIDRIVGGEENRP